MTRAVVDASVVAKWFLDEADSAAALELMLGDWELMAPESLPVEVANALWNAQRRERIKPEFAVAAGPLLRTPEVALIPVAELLPQALEIAVVHGRTVYDCLYVALALRENCSLITADTRLHNALARALPGVLLRLVDLPLAPDDDQ